MQISENIVSSSFHRTVFVVSRSSGYTQFKWVMRGLYYLQNYLLTTFDLHPKLSYEIVAICTTFSKQNSDPKRYNACRQAVGGRYWKVKQFNLINIKLVCCRLTLTVKTSTFTSRFNLLVKYQPVLVVFRTQNVKQIVHIKIENFPH